MNSIHLSIARVSVSIILLCFSTFYYSLLISFRVTASLFSLTSPFCLYTSLLYHLGTRLPSIYSFLRNSLHLSMPLFNSDTLHIFSVYSSSPHADYHHPFDSAASGCTTFLSTKRKGGPSMPQSSQVGAIQARPQ